MNCSKGDMAIVRTTHPMPHMVGTLVECREYTGHEGELRDIWLVDLLGQARRCDSGELVKWGYIEDRYLAPIRPDKTTSKLEAQELRELMATLAKRGRTSVVLGVDPARYTWRR